MSKQADGIPSAAEFGLKRAWYAQQGVSNAVFASIFGSGPNGRTRKQLTQIGIDWQKTLPKAQP